MGNESDASAMDVDLVKSGGSDQVVPRFSVNGLEHSFLLFDFQSSSNCGFLVSRDELWNPMLRCQTTRECLFFIHKRGFV